MILLLYYCVTVPTVDSMLHRIEYRCMHVGVRMLLFVLATGEANIAQRSFFGMRKCHLLGLKMLLNVPADTCANILRLDQSIPHPS